MSNRLYPNWEQLNNAHNELTPGERAFLLFLDEHLPQDIYWTKEKNLADYNGWLIFAQPFLNGSRPDVIIFNPFVGVMIYEIKDWNLRHFKKDDGKVWVSDQRGSYPVKSPLRQVEHYKDKIIGQLVPGLGEMMDKSKVNFGLIKTGVYFHKATTAEAQELFISPNKDTRYFPIIGYDKLKASALKEIVPDVAFTKSYYWDRKWNEELIFWFNPPYHSIEQGTRLTLKGNQVKIATPQSGHYRARGVAGSGKTQALAYRAGNLASQGYNVLIISFNITLWHYIKDMIARAPFKFKWDKLTFNHFHGFCKDKLNEFEAEWPKSYDTESLSREHREAALERFFRSVVPEAVIQAIRKDEYEKYDAILIDEGQDYHFEWYNMLHEHFLSDRDELLVVCDKKQNIYDREMDWIDKRVTRKGLEKFQEGYIDLTTSYRMPQRVAEMSNEFSELFELNQDIKLAKIDGAPVLLYAQHIVWLNIPDDEWLAYVHNAFLRLKRERYNPSDMVILLPNHKYGQACVASFKEKNIEANHVFEDDSEAKYHALKKAFWMGDSRLKISTIHSFKGWELLNIIIYIPKTAPESLKKLDAIVYTAITRTKENLIVLNANNRYQKFGERFPKKWHEQL